MTDSESPTVSDVFKLLNRSRHLPGYPLEGRSAPFFALFLRDILRDRFGKMDETLIPEFPLRIGSLYTKEERQELHPTPGCNQSYNVDYAVFAEDKCSAYLVELKTDMGSKRSKQDEYLCKARDTDFNLLVRGVRDLAKASKSKRKYVHLLHQLSRAGFVPKTDELEQLYEMSFSEDRVVRGWTNAVEGLKFEGRECSETEVVFIQPKADPEPTNDSSRKDNFKYIYFDEVANIVKRHGDLGCTFANFIEQWIKKAGSVDPRCI